MALLLASRAKLPLSECIRLRRNQCTRVNPASSAACLRAFLTYPYEGHLEAANLWQAVETLSLCFMILVCYFVETCFRHDEKKKERKKINFYKFVVPRESKLRDMTSELWKNGQNLQIWFSPPSELRVYIWENSKIKNEICKGKKSQKGSSYLYFIYLVAGTGFHSNF